MQLAHSRRMDIYVQNPKHKSQNTEVTSFEHRTQNICIQNTKSHIGFRINQSLILVCKTRPLNKWSVFLTLRKSNPFPVKRISFKKK